MGVKEEKRYTKIVMEPDVRKEQEIQIEGTKCKSHQVQNLTLRIPTKKQPIF